MNVNSSIIYSHSNTEANEGGQAGIRSISLNSSLKRQIAWDFNASIRREIFKPTYSYINKEINTS
jgi:hypothetical protein